MCNEDCKCWFFCFFFFFQGTQNFVSSNNIRNAVVMFLIFSKSWEAECKHPQGPEV